MLPMTRDFLIKAHEAFDELGYRPSTPSISFDKLQESAIKTLNHTKELEDSINAARMYQFLVKNFEKVCSKVQKHYDFWKTIPYEGNELIALVSDEEAQGTYFITNSFDSDYKRVFACGHSFDDDCVIGVNYSGGKFSFDDADQEYYLRFSKMSSTKMVLLDKNGNKKCIIVLSKDCNVFLENNNTDYEIVLYESGMGIYKKSYIDSLHGGEPDLEQLYAFVEWDILEEKSEFGLARLDLYEADSDLELFMIFAMSCFLLFRSYIKGSTSSIVATSIIYSSWMRRVR